jgi:radical SAM protein with 4Fe4S-binding SPASM domain
MEKDPSFVPKIIHIDLTGKCNFNCLHCRGRFSNAEIDKKEVIRILTRIFQLWGKDVGWVELGGGEPLIYPYLTDVIKFIKQNSKARIIIVSNGFFFDDKTAKTLKSIGTDRIQFSLDGVNAKTHNWLRQNNQSFDKVMNAAKIAKKNKIAFVFRISLNKRNKDQLEDYFKLAKKLGAAEIGVRGCIYVGNAAEFSKELYIEKEDYAKILKSLPILSERYKVHYFSGDPLALIANEKLLQTIKEKYGTLDVYSGCCVGISYLYINNRGNVSFCPMLNELEIGNLKEKDILDIWNNSQEFKNMRKRKMGGKCSSCKFLKLCGGCCAYGFWKEKKLFAENPICTFHKTWKEE